MTTEQWERENQDTLMEYFIDGDPSVRRIQCEYCRKVIYTQTRNRKYCSFQTCGHKMLNLRKSLKKRAERGTYTCACCGEQFLPIRADARYTCEAMKIFLLGAIKQVFQPGCKFETMLCLVGGQGAGKSTFFRLLAVKDEWFSDDLRRLDDDNVYRKLQGHWIIEMSEMIATANAKSIEEIKSFLSKQKETYKVPYETHPADRLRQCVFAGTTNRQDFLPRDRTGNRRFIPVPVDAELAEVHILDNEEDSRAYIDQLWAEAMTIYNSGNYKLAFSPAMQETLQAHQQDFMQEDAQAGMIYAFLEDYAGDRVCSKQLYAEALGNTNIPAEWETRAICEIMNTGISRGDIQGWQAHKTAKRYPKYGVQKGWERVTSPETGAENFSEITDAEAKQLGFPF